ncbi:MAG: ATP-binding protein [Sulfuriferula sp.]|nr:ATP-binding protein [Sulfuriferula sp.]
MIPSAPTLSTVPVEGMLRNLFILRLYAIGGQLLALFAADYWLGIGLPLAAMLTVTALLIALDVVTWLRLAQPWPVTALEFFVQLLADMAALTMLLYYSGGASNPFVSLYLLPIIIAATTLPAAFAWATTILSVIAYSLLTRLFVPLSLPPGEVEFSLHLAGMWLNFIVSAVLIAYFIGKMAGSIRQRDQALARIRETRLHDEQIVALGSLAAGAAHELSTPLATMNIVADELQHDYADDAELTQSLQILRNQVAACKTILTRLTSVGTSGRTESAAVMSADRWLDKLLEQWQLMRPQAQVTTHLRGRLPAPAIMADDSLNQALLNLCNNAADAANNQVEIELDWDEQTLQIDILDRGTGFSDDALSGAVFFTTKREQGGFGIGLFLANASIERHGGSVALLSRDGGGAHVAVRLPLLKQTLA